MAGAASTPIMTSEALGFMLRRRVRWTLIPDPSLQAPSMRNYPERTDFLPARTANVPNLELQETLNEIVLEYWLLIPLAPMTFP